MSSSGSAAGSRPTRPASCCAASPSPGTTSPSSHGCRAGVRRRGHLGGPLRQARLRRRVDRRPRGARTCGSARQADLVVVAPATADLLAKAAHGLADDLLTNTLLTARCPVVFAPAMHTEMWEHPATRANVATLRERGAVVVEPAEGRLTGADTGKGRLPEPDEIFELCARRPRRAAPPKPDLAGRHVVVSAGRHPRVPRPGPLPRQPILGPAGLCPGPRRGRARRRGDAGRRQRAACPTRPASRWSGSRPPASCATRWWPPPPQPTPW